MYSAQHRTIYAGMFVLVTLFFPSSSHASIKVEGTFTISKSCQAYQSIRKKTNPGNISVQPGKDYEAISVNKEEWDWVQLKLPGATPPVRWVEKHCGNADFTAAATKSFLTQPSCKIANQYDSYVLAVTWQPGFCEHASYKGQKPECKAINSGKRKISNLTLHGLWPNRSQCGINYGYCNNQNAMQLSGATVEHISPWMPNFFYQTDFGEYQWKKHGTCQARSDDDYFKTAVSLVQQVDASIIGRYIKENIGQTISTELFRNTLISSLGVNATNKLQLSCSKGRYLQEIRLKLSKDFEQYATLTDKLNVAPASGPFRGNCDKLIYIEEAGSK